MQNYADHISFSALAETLPALEPRLAAGSLIPDIAIPLYLLGSWHLYQAVRPSGRAMGRVAAQSGDMHRHRTWILVAYFRAIADMAGRCRVQYQLAIHVCVVHRAALASWT